MCFGYEECFISDDEEIDHFHNQNVSCKCYSARRFVYCDSERNSKLELYTVL